MDINRIIIYIMLFFVLVGAADQITGSRLRLGNKWEEGIMAMGTLVISTAGLLVLAPLLGSLLKPVIGPAFGWLGADPGIFGGMILDLDTGGAALVQAALRHDPAGFYPLVRQVRRQLGGPGDPVAL